MTARSTKSKVKEAFGLANTAATAAAPEYGLAVAGGTAAVGAGKHAYGKAVTTVHNFRAGDGIVLFGFLVAAAGWMLYFYKQLVEDFGNIGGGSWENPIIKLPGGHYYALWDLLITAGGAIMILGAFRAKNSLLRVGGFGVGGLSVVLNTLMVWTGI